MIGDVLGEADGYGGVLLGVHAIVESYGIAGILATNAQPVAGGLVVGDVGVAAQRRAVVEVVPEHELVVALGAGGIHGVAAPAVAVGLDKLLAAVMGGMQQVAEVGPGERRVTAMAWLAVLVGERLVVAHVGQDVVVALLRVHDVPQILVARVASAVAGVQKLGSLIGVVEEPRALLGKVGVQSDYCLLARRCFFGASCAAELGMGRAAPKGQGEADDGRHDAEGCEQVPASLVCCRVHPLLLPC